MSSNLKNKAFPSLELLLILVGDWILYLLIVLGERVDLVGPLNLLQALLGILYGLCVPGYLIQLILFPKREDLDWEGRLALSFGLSIAIVAPLALILNQFQRGLSLRPFTSTWLGLILLLVIIAWLRQIRQSPSERVRLRLNIPVRQIWQQESKGGRRLLVALSITLLISLSAGVGLALLPLPGSKFTEFYILGEEGMAENYPYTVMVDQPVEINVGINNLEGKAMLYSLEAEDESGVIGEAGPIILQDGEGTEFQFTFTPRSQGEDVEINFYLFCSGISEPYRTTRLITKVIGAGTFP